jgi:hypothetical protein
MANVTFGVITTVARIGVPIDGSIRLNLVGRIAALIEIFAILLLDGGGVA